MLELHTIESFQALPANLQGEVQKALRTKDRLDDFLMAQNGKGSFTEGWVPCPSCAPGMPGVCKRCLPNPGWLYIKEGRDASDIHPSQITRCIKTLVYACTGREGEQEEHVNPQLRRIFDMGTAWHDVMQGYGRRGAWGDPAHYHREAPIDPEAKAHDGTPILPLAYQYWIKGAADALIDRYICRNVPGIGDVSIRVVHEYKTINSNGYGKLTRPKPDHKFQATIYSAVFNVPVVVYMYTNKDNCQTADFPVAFDNSIWNEITSKIRNVQSYVEDGLEPPWEETSAIKNPSECMECGFRKSCAPPMVKSASAGGQKWRS